MQTENLLEIAKLAQFNDKSEAQAILDYTEMIRAILNSDLEQSDKEYLISIIEELIADELNHQQRLSEIYTFLTSIEPKKD